MAALDEAHNTGAALGKTWLNEALAVVDASEGELDAAASRLNEVIADSGAWPWQVAHCEGLLAWVVLAGGDVSSGKAHAEKQAALARQLESPLNEAHALELLGRCALAEGEHGRASELLHEAVALLAEFGFGLQLPSDESRVWPRLQPLRRTGPERHASWESLRQCAGRSGRCGSYGRRTETGLRPGLLAAMGSAAFDGGFHEGEGMPEVEAIAWTLRGRGARKRPPAGWDSLTPTEQEVVGLVAKVCRILTSALGCSSPATPSRPT